MNYGTVNRRNMHYWSVENLYWLREHAGCPAHYSAIARELHTSQVCAIFQSSEQQVHQSGRHHFEQLL